MDAQTNEYSGDAGPERYDAIVSRLAQQDKVPWYKKPNLRLLYLIMLPSCIGVEMTSGFDSSMLNGLQAVTSWLDFYNHPRSALLGLMSAMYPLGGIAALPSVPSVADNLGRRSSVLFGSTLMIFGGILQGAAQNFAMFLIARFILGSGIVFALVAASSLVGELSHPKERATMTCLFHVCYYIGAITAAGVTLGTFAIPNNWGWRIPSFLQIVPSLLQVSFIWFLPESPRWLISKGRGAEAHAILVKYHAEGDEISEFVKAEYTQIKKTLEVELKNTEMSWREVLSTPGMRKRFIISSFLGLFTQWSGNGLIAYFLSPILDNIGIHDNRTKNIVNLSNSCWGLVNATFLALTVTRFPRRRIFLACTISILIVFTAWTVASEEYERTKSSASSQAVLALIFLYSPAYNMGFNALTYTFLVELFPFHVRAKGITIFQWWSNAAGFFSQFVNPIGIGNAGWKYYIIYCIWIAFEVAFVYFMFPETSNRTLEELTFLYEGDHGREAVRRIGEEIQHEQGYGDAVARDSDSVEDIDSWRGHGSTTHLLADWE
ncbi:general substrate transporter [Melanogaster broomeanus]|nr:general substrate transporter [Melanogaster broomeanus]KAF9236185.1 general substrate transporter [Melanogaster broomeanus]